MTDLASSRLLDQFAKVVNAAPVEAIRDNARAWFASQLKALELVTREEFDIQVELLRRCEARIAALEAQLESRTTGSSTPKNAP